MESKLRLMQQKVFSFRSVICTPEIEPTLSEGLYLFEDEIMIGRNEVHIVRGCLVFDTIRLITESYLF